MAKTERVQNPAMRLRSMAVVPSSIDEKNRSVDVVCATELPVAEPDYERYEMVDTVVLMDGIRIPQSRSVSMLDSHNRFELDGVIGSIQDIRVDGDKLVGRAVFADLGGDDRSWKLVKDGHVRDLSIGRVDERKQFVTKDQTVSISGKSFTGPKNVVTSSRLCEVSFTAVGADENAKVRELQELKDKSDHGSKDEPGDRGQEDRSALHQRSPVMDKILKSLLVSRGLPKDTTDDAAVAALVDRGMPKDTKPEEIRAWVETNLDTLTFTKATPPDAVDRSAPTADRPTGVDMDAIARKFDEMLNEREGRRVKVRGHIVGRLAKFGMPESVADEIAAKCSTVEAADQELLERLASRQTADFKSTMPYMAYGREQGEKMTSTLKTVLATRVLDFAKIGDAARDKVFPKAERERDIGEYRNMGIFEIARECVAAEGMNVRSMSRPEIAQAAFGFGGNGFSHRSSPLGTTGSFVNITLDAINKVLTASYDEYPQTCRICFRQAPSVADFKTKNVIKLGALPNLPVVPEGTDIPMVLMKDEKESYAVEARGEAFLISWQAVVNDDLDAFSRLPQKFGAAAARTLNAVVWAQVTGNPTLNDSVALFAAATGNRKRTNLTTGAGAPSVSTVQTLTNLMMQMRGLNTPEQNEGSDIISPMPRFIVGPTELRTTILQLVNSVADPASSNANVFNPVYNNLIPVIEPLLSASSTTAWYLFADYRQIDTIEFTFLQGQETPKLDSWVDPRSKALVNDVVQTFAAKAIDHRGSQKHAGA